MYSGASKLAWNERNEACLGRWFCRNLVVLSEEGGMCGAGSMGGMVFSVANLFVEWLGFWRWEYIIG